MSRRYLVLLTPEPDGSAYNVVVPDLPGCFTFGDTVEEAIEMAKDAITTYLDDESAAEFPDPFGAIVAHVEAPVVEEDGILRARIPVVAGASETASDEAPCPIGRGVASHAHFSATP